MSAEPVRELIEAARHVLASEREIDGRIAHAVSFIAMRNLADEVAAASTWLAEYESGGEHKGVRQAWHNLCVKEAVAEWKQRALAAEARWSKLRDYLNAWDAPHLPSPGPNVRNVLRTILDKMAEIEKEDA